MKWLVFFYIVVPIVACVDVASSEGDGRGKRSVNYEHVVVNVVSFLHAAVDVPEASLNFLLLCRSHLSFHRAVDASADDSCKR